MALVSSTISLQQTKMIARKANLTLTEEELEMYHKDLQSIFEYTDKLQEVDTEGIDPNVQTNGLSNIVREDQVTESLPLDLVLGSSAKVAEETFEVGAILK